MQTQNVSEKYYSITTNDQELNKKPVSDFAEIWESKQTGAKSLHSRVEILPGDTIAKIGIRKYVENPNYLSLQISDKQHILLSPEYLQYINHSCDPNIFFDTTEMVVRCLEKINIGEAITFFYPSTEWSMEQGFNCLCGSKRCLREIKGAAYLSEDIIKRYQFNQHIISKL
ncbi:MAG: SET domain-containing protein [Sphaerospermopsis sp. SIO1G2]|nr:SET domain-containing protein [Sphaerospermopsis sp. SIO1G2]